MKGKTIRRISSLMLLFALLLSACAKSPDQVRIASEKEIRAYAEQNYGIASSSQVSQGENSRTVTFTDSEYGFTYSVESHAMALGIDNSTFGYTESKSSDFASKYYRTLYDLAEKEFHSRYDLTYGYCMENSYECHICHVSADDAGKITEEVGAYLDRLDTRNFYRDSDSCVKAYGGQEQDYIGSWHLSDGKYYYYADENIEGMTIYAEADINSAASEKKKIRFLYWEQMDVSEVPGIENWELVDHTMDDGTVVTLYWFDIDGEKHFFADIRVWNIGDVYYSDTMVDRRN